jgi:Spy/CpxP family protein refolding chaperone
MWMKLQSSLPEPQMQQIRTLREDIRKLVAANREDEARAVEEKAMQLLGYKKMWLACGPGTFMWVKFEPA